MDLCPLLPTLSDSVFPPNLSASARTFKGSRVPIAALFSLLSGRRPFFRGGIGMPVSGRSPSESHPLLLLHPTRGGAGVTRALFLGHAGYPLRGFKHPPFPYRAPESRVVLSSFPPSYCSCGGRFPLYPVNLPVSFQARIASPLACRPFDSLLLSPH